MLAKQLFKISLKHEKNVFGPSDVLVAADGDAIVGFRAFMRWQFEQTSATSSSRVRWPVRSVCTGFLWWHSMKPSP